MVSNPASSLQAVWEGPTSGGWAANASRQFHLDERLPAVPRIEPVAMPDLAVSVVSDDELIAALAAGETEALGILYDRHAHGVLALLARILGDRGAAEDLLQEVFLRAWRQADSFDETRGTVRSWLHCMTHSLALNEIRRLRRRPQIQQQPTRENPAAEDILLECVDPAADPASDACCAVRDSFVATALEHLPPAQRVVIEMYAAGYSQSEIATHLGEPLGTVKSRMRRGLLHLRSSLTSLGIDAS